MTQPRSARGGTVSAIDPANPDELDRISTRQGDVLAAFEALTEAGYTERAEELRGFNDLDAQHQRARELTHETLPSWRPPGRLRW